MTALSSSSSVLESASKEINSFTSPGTLRGNDFSRPKVQWRRTKLPAGADAMPIGWKKFFLNLEDGESLMQAALGGAAQVCDGLSFPATVDFVLSQLLAGAGQGRTSSTTTSTFSPTNLLVLGAANSEKTVLEKTNYFELLVTKHKLRLHFVGPEVKVPNGKEDPVTKNSKTVSKLEKLPLYRVALPNICEKFCQFKKQSGSPLTPANTLVMVYNGGFGNRLNHANCGKKQPLFHTWLPDLFYLSKGGFVCAFTCADRQNDLVGELITHALLLKSRFVLAPMGNPFHFATSMVGDAGPDDAYCGNSQLYVVQGSSPDRKVPAEVAGTDLEAVGGLRKLFDAASATVNVKALDGTSCLRLPGCNEVQELEFAAGAAAGAPAAAPAVSTPSSPSSNKGVNKQGVAEGVEKNDNKGGKSATAAPATGAGGSGAGGGVEKQEPSSVVTTEGGTTKKKRKKKSGASGHAAEQELQNAGGAQTAAGAATAGKSGAEAKITTPSPTVKEQAPSAETSGSAAGGGAAAASEPPNEGGGAGKKKKKKKSASAATAAGIAPSADVAKHAPSADVKESPTPLRADAKTQQSTTAPVAAKAPPPATSLTGGPPPTVVVPAPAPAAKNKSKKTAKKSEPPASTTAAVSVQQPKEKEPPATNPQSSAQPAPTTTSSKKKKNKAAAAAPAPTAPAAPPAATNGPTSIAASTSEIAAQIASNAKNAKKTKTAPEPAPAKITTNAKNASKPAPAPEPALIKTVPLEVSQPDQDHSKAKKKRLAKKRRDEQFVFVAPEEVVAANPSEEPPPPVTSGTGPVDGKTASKGSKSVAEAPGKASHTAGRGPKRGEQDEKTATRTTGATAAPTAAAAAPSTSATGVVPPSDSKAGSRSSVSAVFSVSLVTRLSPVTVDFENVQTVDLKREKKVKTEQLAEASGDGEGDFKVKGVMDGLPVHYTLEGSKLILLLQDGGEIDWDVVATDQELKLNFTANWFKYLSVRGKICGVKAAKKKGGKGLKVTVELK